MDGVPDVECPQRGPNRNDPLCPATLQIGNHAKICVLTNQNVCAMCQIGVGHMFLVLDGHLGQGH